MQLLNPIALLLLPLALVPLLLARRRPPTRYAVATMHLWRAAADASQERLTLKRIRRTWLVVVEIGCIATMVIVAAQPMLTSIKRSTAVIVDLSASMAARDHGSTRIAEAQRDALAVVARLPPAQRVHLIGAGPTPRDVGTYVAADPALRRAIGGLAPTASGADLISAIDRGAADDDVVVVSDRVPKASQPTARSSHVRWHRVGVPADNVAIARISVERAVIGDNAGRVLIGLHNFGRAAQDAEVEISVDGRAVRRASTFVPAGEERVLVETLRDLGRVVTARLLADDALPVDNVRSAIVPELERYRVLLRDDAGTFLERALTADPLVAVERSSGAVLDSDVVVCGDCREPLPAHAGLLAIRRSGVTNAYGPLALVRPEHPVASALDVAGLSGSVAPVDRTVRDADVLLRAGGAPAIRAYDRGDRRVVEVDLDLAQPDLVLSVAFPVLVANAIEWLSRRDESALDVVAGEPLRVVADASTSVRVAGPDGRPREAVSVGRTAVVADTAAAGIYRVRAGAAERLGIVNPVVDGESDLRAIQSVEIPRETRSAVAIRELAVAPWASVLALALGIADWRLRTERAS